MISGIEAMAPITHTLTAAVRTAFRESNPEAVTRFGPSRFFRVCAFLSVDGVVEEVRRDLNREAADQSRGKYQPGKLSGLAKQYGDASDPHRNESRRERLGARRKNPVFHARSPFRTSATLPGFVRHFLGEHRQFGRLENVSLGHRVFGSIQQVENHFSEEGETGRAVAVDLLFLLSVDQEELVGGFLSRQGDIFSDLHGSLGSDDKDPSIAPDSQAVRGEPVDPAIAGSARIHGERALAEVLQSRFVRDREIGDPREIDLPVGGAGEGEELLELVGPNIGQNSAVLFLFEKPIGTGVFSRADAEPGLMTCRTLPTTPSRISSVAFIDDSLWSRSE